MKLFFKTLIMLIGLGGMAGCSTSGYLGNRGRDAADIFTATVGLGVGAKARIGPVQAGALAMSEGVGLRCGCFGGASGRQKFSFAGEYVFIVAGGEDTGSIKAIADLRDKTFRTKARFPFVTTPEFHKIYQVDSSEFPYNHTTQVSGFCESYYSQIEVVGALGPSVRLGFNPGELLDFVLGWTTLDIYGDDLEKRDPMKFIRQRRAYFHGSPPRWAITSSSLEEKRVEETLEEMIERGEYANMSALTGMGKTGLSLLLDRVLPETRLTRERDAASVTLAISRLGSSFDFRRNAAREELLASARPFAQLVCQAAVTGDERIRPEAQVIVNTWRKDDSWLFENGSCLSRSLEAYLDTLSGEDIYAELAKRSARGLLRGLEKDSNKCHVIELCLLQVARSQADVVYAHLLPLLTSDDPTPAIFAMKTLAGQTGNQYISPLHIGALQSGRREMVMSSLSSMSCNRWRPVSPKLMEAIIPHLKSEDPVVRQEAASTLGVFIGDEVMKWLVILLQDPEASVYQKASQRLLEQDSYCSEPFGVRVRLRKAMAETTNVMLRNRIKFVLNFLETRPNDVPLIWP